MVTVTTTPAIIYLFMQLASTSFGTEYRIMYSTTDESVCREQAKSWNAAIAPNKAVFFCVEHRQTKLKEER